jgi:hypothetical protein
MRIRTPIAASIVLAVATAGLTPAMAAPKAKSKPKPITKTYTANAPLPSPTNVQTGVCHADVPQSADDQVFTAPFTGRLSAKLTGFTGDWDFAFQQNGANAAESAQQITEAPDRPESIESYKLKKGEEITVRACNFAGGATATVSYSFVSV